MTETNGKRIAVVGGGIAGLTAALRLAEQGFEVDVYEAAPALGGRTKSFYFEPNQTWVDNGPHLMVGAYTETQKLLADVGIGHHVTWQSSLCLPLWQRGRGFFAFKAPAWLPIPLALLWGVARMPNHGFASVIAMLKLALTMNNRDESQTVAQWLAEINAPDILIEDMLEVLCLGVMNEPLATANAKTFARVLALSFASHQNAKLGWFNQCLSQALIAPVAEKAKQLGVSIHLKHTVRDLSALPHEKIVLTIPAYARNRLLGIDNVVETQVITNIHLWFDTPITLPSMMLGLLGTYGQWLFDVSEMTSEHGLQHLCVTVSADETTKTKTQIIEQVKVEIEQALNISLPKPIFQRVVSEKRATVSVRANQNVDLPLHVFDACESPYPGQLPATIELAVISGSKAADWAHLAHKINA